MSLTLSEDLLNRQRFGIVPAFRVSQLGKLFSIELEMADDADGANNETIATLPPGTEYFVVILPPGTTKYFRWWHVRQGYDDGNPTAWAGATVDPIPEDYPRLQQVPQARNQPLADGNFAASGNASGNLISTVKKLEGGQAQPILRHVETGVAQDGDSVTYPTAFQSNPLLILVPRQTIVLNDSMTGSDNYLRLLGDTQTPSGFVLVAKNVTTGATTGRADKFPTGNDLDAEDETTELTVGANAPSNDDAYTFNYDVELYAEVDLGAPADETCTVDIEIAFEIDIAGAGSWVEYATRSYNATQVGTGNTTETWDNEAVEVTKGSIVGSTSKFRLKLKTVTIVPGATGSPSPTASVHGHNNPDDGDSPDGLTYNTASDTVESATPNDGDGVRWIAIEVV